MIGIRRRVASVARRASTDRWGVVPSSSPRISPRLSGSEALGGGGGGGLSNAFPVFQIAGFLAFFSAASNRWRVAAISRISVRSGRRDARSGTRRDRRGVGPVGAAVAAPDEFNLTIRRRMANASLCRFNAYLLLPCHLGPNVFQFVGDIV